MKPHLLLLLLLSMQCAGLGLAGSLTCLSLLPSEATSNSSSTNPLFKSQTVIAKAALEGEVCFKYIARCTANTTMCNDEQVAEGVWRWVYGSMPSSACAAISNNEDENIQSAYCCSSNNCNVPDAQVDPETRLDPSVQLSSAAASEPVAAATAAVADTSASSHAAVLVNTSSGNKTESRTKSAAALIDFWPASAHINKVSVPKKAGVYKQPKPAAATPKQQQDKQHQHTHTAKDSKPNNSDKRGRTPHHQQQQQHPRQQPKHMSHGSQIPNLICYRNVPRERHLAPAVAPRMFRKADGVDMCGSYKFQCANGDNTCTATEVKGRVWKWAYMPLSSATCLELKAYSNRRSSVIQHVQCCSSDHCNRPVPRLDKLTKVITQTAAGLYSKNQQVAKSGRSLLAAAAAAAAAVSTSSHAQQQKLEGTLRPNRLECFTSMPRTAEQAPAVVPKLYQINTDGVDVCGRYQLKCSQDRRAACTAADAEAEAWTWEYKPLSAALCAEMKAIAALGSESGYRDVMCCSGNACNRPDVNVDPVTKILSRDAA